MLHANAMLQILVLCSYYCFLLTSKQAAEAFLIGLGCGGQRVEFGREKQAIMTKNELLLLYNEEAQSLAYQQRPWRLCEAV